MDLSNIHNSVCVSVYKIAIVGAPGSGKSTLAAEIYTILKKQGYNIELVREYIRELFSIGWKPETIADQYYIMHKQHEYEQSVSDSVDMIVTDSPIILPFYYGNKLNTETLHDRMIFGDLQNMFLKHVHNYDFIIVLERSHDYVEDGVREQTEAESDKIHDDLVRLMDLYKIEQSICGNYDDCLSSAIARIVFDKGLKNTVNDKLSVIPYEINNIFGK